MPQPMSSSMFQPTTPPSQPLAGLPDALPDAILFAVTGERVRSLRAAAGVTQTELARALGYHRSSICRWEARPDTPIPAAQVDPLLAFFRARYDVGEGRRTQVAEIEQRLGQASKRPRRH